ncbi:non-structural maintenance of chromosomes element 1 homolog [Anopheles arabiensis]|uniref:Non-structural maintenance of chromosomes element 1 homolog n=1 Tax=Anopheles arabiensis TaxID=7173 RepID=A0A182HM54_ANOAR|nr:non-structural maintenance of chromosomes element 1 homolog [Anopheles arabiensis]
MSENVSYTNVHRAFLQACSNHGTLSTSQAFNMYVAICAQHDDSHSIPSEADLASVIEAINERIYRFDQKIALVHYDPTDMDFYVFVSLQESPIDLQQNVFTAPELHFFRVLLRELALSEDHTLALIACLNLTNDTASEGMKPLAKTRAEQLLQEWEQLGYFLTLNDKCYLGPKAVVEFEKYITRNYADVVTRCCLCNVTIFYGVKCASCPQILHKDCMKKYLRRLTNCPACKTLWSVPL